METHSAVESIGRSLIDDDMFQLTFYEVELSKSNHSIYNIVADECDLLMSLTVLVFFYFTNFVKNNFLLQHVVTCNLFCLFFLEG